MIELKPQTIALALLAGSVDIARDYDRAWGVASRELLGPLKIGLVGLMLAGLFAAAMSTIDSGINGVTSVIVFDWFRGRQLSLRMSRILSAVLGLAVIGAALLVPVLGDTVIGNGVKLEESGYIVGRELKVDARAEMTEDAEANMLVSRPYRQGFVVPMEV